MSMPRTVEMPPYEKVRALYMSGLPWNRIAARYHVNQRSLYTRMRHDAERAGHAWPWRDASGAANRARHKSASTELIRLELQDFREWSGVTYAELANQARLHSSTIYRITSGHKLTLSKKTADKIMRVIERYEEKAA